MGGADTLVGWRSRHDDLARRLVDARRRVPEPDDVLVEAIRALDDALTLHVGQEERWILPAFDGVGERAAANQRPRVVRHDHRLIEHLLAQLRSADRVRRAELLGQLADVLDHHDRREAAGMLPLVDQALGDLVPSLLAAIRAEEGALPTRSIGPLTPRPALPRPDLPPIDLLRWAAAHDQPLVDVPVPDHPKGPALHARLREAMDRAATDDLEVRRDALSDVIDRLRLVEIVATSR